MSCPFAHDDGAYVLGALSPAERRAFEQHLPGCAPCTAAVSELAGLPGLLGRVDESVVALPVVEDPVPETLLPALSREVGRARRRRTLTAVGLAAAAAVAVVAVVTAVTGGQADGDGSAAPTPPGASSSPADPGPSGLSAREMRPVGEVPVRATIALEPVGWGTRLELICTYDAEWVEYELPPEVDYGLFVRTRDGGVEQVGSWRSIDGPPMHVTAATAASLDELASVEVRTGDGRVVLRLAT